MSTVARGRSVLVVLALPFLLLSCQDQSADSIDPGDLQLVVVSGDGQTGPAFAELTQPLVVKVVNKNGTAGLPNQAVNFVVVEGGGSVYAGVATTDRFGMAAEYWTLGEPGPQTLEARAVSGSGDKLVYGVFTATAEPPGPTVYYDEAEFIAATGAVATVTFPSARGLTPAPYTENGVTLVQAFGFNNQIQDHTPIFSGNEFGVTDAENVNITLTNPVQAFGFWMQDGFAVGNIGCPSQDSRFRFTIFSASQVLGEFLEDPPIDQAFFFGVSSSVPITKVEIRELDAGGNVAGSDYCENDFLSTILVK